MSETVPGYDAKNDPLSGAKVAAHLVLTPSWTDPATGAVYVHKDLERVVQPWDVEAHVGPISTAERFGDVASWVAYVQKYQPFGLEDSGWTCLLTWSKQGLLAVLDYHSLDGETGRCQWTASHPFVESREWGDWTKFANGSAHDVRTVVERLEDLGEDILEPSAAELMVLLRNLRANVKAEVVTELREDGTTSISASRDSTVARKDGAAVSLPPAITIAIPVLAGHNVKYQLAVRLRASVDDHAHLALRLSLVNAERAREQVLAEQVAEAQAALGDGYRLLRAAD